MKKCAACKLLKGEHAFYRHRRSRDGLYYICRGCAADESRRDRAKNGDSLRRGSLQWYMENTSRAKGTAAAWRAANKERVSASWASWYAANRDSVLVRRRADPRYAAAARRRQAAKLNATPGWANAFFIEEAYDLARRRTKATGVTWEVDHIVPLVSKVVCGLHVEHNLRVIPTTMNRAKGNRWVP